MASSSVPPSGPPELDENQRPAHSDAGGVPCNENSWDHVRSKKGLATLQCRKCHNRKLRVESLSNVKCQDFVSGGCSGGDKCPKLHIHKQMDKAAKVEHDPGCD